MKYSHSLNLRWPLFVVMFHFTILYSLNGLCQHPYLGLMLDGLRRRFSVFLTSKSQLFAPSRVFSFCRRTMEGLESLLAPISVRFGVFSLVTFPPRSDFTLAAEKDSTYCNTLDLTYGQRFT